MQKHDDLHHDNVQFFADRHDLRYIRENQDRIEIGASCTATDLLESPVLNRQIPRLKEYLKLVSSTPIRNMGSIAGNFVNASPIGDLTSMFIALDSSITLVNGEQRRTILLRDLYLGYKQLDKKKDEHIDMISFPSLDGQTSFNFEKVSKRTYLDIASVNSSIRIKASNNIISNVHLSAGGVAPVPLYLRECSSFLSGKEISPDNIMEANRIAQEEISPISDARGDAAYKRLLLRQLLFAHFIELFPETIKLEDLI